MNLESLKNKKILFISVKTFNYELEIANKLRYYGANVDYFDERPSNTLIIKGVIRLNRSFLNKAINNYYESILRKIKHEKYDYFLLIKGEVIPSFFLKKLKLLQKDCFFIYYTWDSFENNPNALSILHFFDKKLTFDPLDAQSFKLEFRPLFYLDKYEKIKNIKTIKYKLLFLGTAHSDRYRISNNVVNWCKENGFSTFTYYYMQSKFVYFFKSIFDVSFKHFDFRKLNFKPLSTDEVIKYFRESSIILDINHPNQRGLTMRIFEALGAQKKIITTNKEVKKYSFYDQNNIFVIDRDNIELDREFFESNFKPLSEIKLSEMSIGGWIKSIFFNNHPSYWLN